MRKERSMPAIQFHDLKWPKFKALHDVVELKSSSSMAGMHNYNKRSGR